MISCTSQWFKIIYTKFKAIYHLSAYKLKSPKMVNKTSALPFFIPSIRSSPPTTSAPAALASSAAPPSAKTAILTG